MIQCHLVGTALRFEDLLIRPLATVSVRCALPNVQLAPLSLETRRHHVSHSRDRLKPVKPPEAKTSASLSARKKTQPKTESNFQPVLGSEESIQGNDAAEPQAIEERHAHGCDSGWVFGGTPDPPEDSPDVDPLDALDGSDGKSHSQDTFIGKSPHDAKASTFRKLESDTPQYPFKIPRGKPYSIPQPELFAGILPGQTQHRLRGKREKEIPMAKWLADRAGPPLLLTLDAFDTLYTPREPVPRQYADVASRFGYDVGEEQVQTHFKKAFKAVSAEFPNQGQGKIHYREWWTKVIERTFEPFKIFRRPWPDPDLTERLYSTFSSRMGYTMFPDVKEFLSMIGTCWQAWEWAPRRTMLGVISNSDPRLYDILRSFGVEVQREDTLALYPPRYAPDNRTDDPRFGPAGFSFATISYECGSEKPDEYMFNQAVTDAQRVLDSLSPVARLTRSGRHLLTNIGEQFQFMHVGDSLEKDVIPAMRLGWDAVLLDRSAEEAISERNVDELGRSVTVINSLMSLHHVITKERLQAGLDARLGKNSSSLQDGAEADDPLDRLSEIRRERRGRISSSRRHTRPQLPLLQQKEDEQKEDEQKEDEQKEDEQKEE